MSVRRVVVALDASARSREAARAAAALARALEAELAGLFVEDENLLRLAALPFARHQPVSGGPARPLDLGAVEAQLRGLASAARQELERAAASVDVRWTFEVRRGPLPGEALEAARGTDLLLLGVRTAELAREALAGRLDEPAPPSGRHRPAASRPAVVVVVAEGAGEPDPAEARLLAELGLTILRLRLRR